MATYAAAVQTMDKEWAELERRDRALAAKDAELLAAEARLKETEATANLRMDHLLYETAKTMSPMPKQFLPMSTPSVEAVADHDLAELAEQEATLMGSRCTKNAAARTDKQVSHQRYVAARGKEQRAVDAQRKARDRNRLQSRNRRFDYGVDAPMVESEVSTTSAKSKEAKGTVAEGNLQKPMPVSGQKTASCRPRKETSRGRVVAKRAAARLEREFAKRATRRYRMNIQGKRCRINSRLSSKSEDGLAPVEPATPPPVADQSPSGFGAVVKSWFSGLFGGSQAAPEPDTTPTATAANGAVSTSLARRRLAVRSVGMCYSRKATKQARLIRLLGSRASRRHADKSVKPLSRDLRTKAMGRCHVDGVVKIGFGTSSVEMEGLLRDLISVPAFVQKPVAAEQKVDLDLLDALEAKANVQKPCRGSKNTSALTSKEISCRRWEAARDKDTRARNCDRKVRGARRGEARDRKLSAADVE